MNRTICSGLAIGRDSIVVVGGDLGNRRFVDREILVLLDYLLGRTHELGRVPEGIQARPRHS